MQPKHLITVADLSLNDIDSIFKMANEMKSSLAGGKVTRSLEGKTLALVFEKSSLRTRVSFDVAMRQLGGGSIYLSRQDIDLGHRESVRDVAMTLSRYVDAIALRTFAHETVLEMAKNSCIPVINALSDRYHPCQALTDLYTIKEKRGTLKGLKVSFVGDGNNVARSLALLCARLGVAFSIASPNGYGLDKEFLDEIKVLTKVNLPTLSDDPKKVVKGADVIYTDTWVSMGQEVETEKRRRDFKGYCVDAALVALAKKDVLVMHCLPAHRDEEITSEVLDGPNSIVYDQAENRLHVQKAVLKLLLLSGKQG
ncbi:MAG: ornithine carbamoyltransferase [Planctomycetes bacterium RIFCSPHIGHO2_02_FULL_50_42]|nr:MAG: ornithine carbamoyltransferase [Planctomycetes bacterium GWA2_50_13]OHB88504.1 MAG: ornithine carbamoyltransferase [Planctomycetes bacterium RIFCSPHIGHO2_02_FULL_50_42]OHB92367.1 MAG: ornithine carbamoyltransferase [Planctomycetes bacterium RIFCSPHIGHO2_12_FULL_51_37]OHB94676.1 MAG: ornithine carbamoyltransferase [Planctomycetes bacterium RIFCSPLOWO2_02_FULL_50_16]OHC04394.1 MAG: ornithine carbamoyltransferase [Planctomycetes bacterium RIFCSPLOWO2_12_FULL_50_35]